MLIEDERFDIIWGIDRRWNECVYLMGYEKRDRNMGEFTKGTYEKNRTACVDV